MTELDGNADLRRYLQDAREALLWKLDGLPEYDVRRPLVPTGTNLLGLVKHAAGGEMGYFGDTFGRPCPDQLPWDESDPNSDMFARPDESRDFITGLYRRAWAHADATIEALPLDAVGPASPIVAGVHRIEPARARAAMVASYQAVTGDAGQLGEAELARPSGCLYALKATGRADLTDDDRASLGALAARLPLLG